jgi:predicted transglutaminase-like cysteine proteinase
MDMNKNKISQGWRAAVSAILLTTSVPATAMATQAYPHMQTGQATSQPIGHYNYCKKNMGDCSVLSANTAAPKLTRQRWEQMVSANAYANRTVSPVTDLDYYGVEELWTLPGKFGDCEDFVLLKRKMLLELGWPASALLITVVRQPNGDGHAVLTVRTDRADYVLDNLDDRIFEWDETEYTYLKRQSERNSGRWTDIIDSRRLVGSVK